jgi:hypothetical protein
MITIEKMYPDWGLNQILQLCVPMLYQLSYRAWETCTGQKYVIRHWPATAKLKLSPQLTIF